MNVSMKSPTPFGYTALPMTNGHVSIETKTTAPSTGIKCNLKNRDLVMLIS